MVKLLLTAIIFFVPLAATAADEGDGGYIAPERASLRRGVRSIGII